MLSRRCAALLLTASTIAGCGGKPPILHSRSTAGRGSQSSASQPAPAGSIKGADGRFATVIPAGFVDATKKVQGGAINIEYLAVGPRRQGFATNINVVREQSRGQASIDSIVGLELAGIKRLEPQAHSFSQVQSLTVDGEPARSVDYL